MSEEFKLEVVNPEKSFLSKDDVTEVVIPAFEGEMGILKDHISIISFLKPGIIKIYSKLGEEKYYVEDGIIEFKNNNLSILTSSIFNIKDMEKYLDRCKAAGVPFKTMRKSVKDIKHFLKRAKAEGLEPCMDMSTYNILDNLEEFFCTKSIK